MINCVAMCVDIFYFYESLILMNKMLILFLHEYIYLIIKRVNALYVHISAYFVYMILLKQHEFIILPVFINVLLFFYSHFSFNF